MGLLDVHADGIRQSFDFQLRAPQPDEPPASFNLWSAAGAGFKSVGRAALESGANLADLGAAIQQGDINALGAADLTEAQRAAKQAEFEQLRGKFTDLGKTLRLRSAEMAPDPLTAHKADQVISSVGTGVVRAAGAIATTGPVAGSVIFGAGEADSTYHEAIDRGIDPDTATKLAATTGVISAATAGLPAGGPGIKSTIALAAGAGPASYVAQEAISKKILQSAGYSDEAAMHDPTDPLGLALSIALPGVAGGLHIRSLAKQKTLADVALNLESGGKRFGPDGQILTSKTGAQGEMQVEPSTQTNPGFGVRPAALGPDGKPTPDEIARVGVDYIAAMQNRYGGDPAKTLAAYNAGPGALDAAIAKHGDNWLAHMPDETKAYVQKGMQQLGDHAVQHAANDPDTVDAARLRVTNDALQAHLPDHPDAFIELQRATDAVSQGPVHEVLPDAQRVSLEAEQADIERQRAELAPELPAIQDGQSVPFTLKNGEKVTIESRVDPGSGGAGSELVARNAKGEQIGSVSFFRGSGRTPLHSEVRGDYRRQGLGTRLYDLVEATGTKIEPVERLSGTVSPDALALRASRDARAQQLAALDQRHAEVTQQLQSVPLTSARPAPSNGTALAVREALRPDEGVPKATDAPPDMFRPRQPGTREAQPQFAPAPPKVEAPGAAPKPAGESKPAMVKVEPPSLEVQRAEALVTDNPDLRVQLPGSTETVNAGEALARAKAEAEHDAGAAELIRAAVQCALSFGD